MNIWQDVFMAESHRQQIVEDMEQIRLEELALRSRTYHPAFFNRTMFNFANWMISTGKQLRKRYTPSCPDEIPTVDCGNIPTGSFVE